MQRLRSFIRRRVRPVTSLMLSTARTCPRAPRVGKPRASSRALAQQTRLPLDEWSLARVTHTAQHRAGMDARARQETVEAAFEVVRPRLIADERVLLIDDVFTTGATVAACAHVLKEAGAEEVFVLTVARA